MVAKHSDLSNKLGSSDRILKLNYVGQASVKITPMVYDILYTQLKGAREGDVSLMGHVHKLTDYSKYNRT